MSNKVIFMITTKPYDDYSKNIQINAINSWLRLSINKLIVINSDDPDNKKYFNHSDIKIVPLKRQSPTHVPYVRDVFESGYNYYESGDMLCYINADIMLQDDFCVTLKAIPIHTYGNYLIGGRKWSWMNKSEFLKIQEFPLNIEEIKKFGSLDMPCATDYFIHNKELYQNLIPDDMLIARANWDMWLNALAINKNATTIDITNTCFSVHPGHEYGDKKTLRGEYYNTIMKEIKINRKYESPNGTIDRYKYYTIMDGENIVIKERK